MKTSTYSLLLILLLAFPKVYSNSPPLISSASSISTQDIVKLFYSNGQIQIDGLMGTGSIQIYSIIGNEIARFSNETLANFKKPVALESGNMYIVRIETETNVKTYKLIAN
ncbi:T9SS type A sorting domain-containing protein [Flavobacteriaceae bacterium]|nr:T9SS type A sorting domain-containing protein [Flavobacteriaceae bacterium]MDB4153120.1 T9SS type A sorting domain-containing protein [Flavobacteriaceae bacterium]|tara:strand:- start:5004 stop:5336 length:333 start_codon:yes stop_codon:yes gene_type:complete